MAIFFASTHESILKIIYQLCLVNASAIIGKNPGSAKPSKIGSLEQLELDGDKLLPFERSEVQGTKCSNVHGLVMGFTVQN